MNFTFAKDSRAALSNVVFKLLSVPVERVCRLLIVLVAAPVIGATGFGIYQFAATVTGLLAICNDLGLNIWTTRALARDPAAAETIVGTGLTLRGLALPPTILIMALAARAQAPGDARRAFVLLGVAALAQAFVEYCGAIFRGYERLRDEAWLNGLRAVFMTGAGLGGLRLEPSVTGLATGLMIGAAASGALGVSILHRRYRLAALFRRPTFDRRLARVALTEALPLWIAGLLSTLYFRCDVLFLSAIAGDAELGTYSAAYKVFEASLILPATIMAAAFTPLARAHGDHDRQRRWELQLATLLFVLGALAGAVLYGTSDRVVGRLFGAGFSHAAASLRVLALAMAIAFVNRGLTHFLMARNLERRYLVVAAFLLLVNVGANLILIPRLGGPGAAWATLITEGALALSAILALVRPSRGDADATERRVAEPASAVAGVDDRPRIP